MAKEKDIAVSVIIPVYNAEKYIGECLESLYNQTMKNFEIIFVDDCSTDNGIEIVEKYMKRGGPEQCSLIKTSRQSGCPGLPRNIGMDYAKGEYVYFMDSDDFLDKDVLENLYKVAKKFKADIVDSWQTFHYKAVDGEFKDQIYAVPDAEPIETATLETADIQKRYRNYLDRKYSAWVWDKLFRRKFLVKNNIKFPPISISEDYIFLIACLILAKNYVRIPFIGHHYRVNNVSVTHTRTVADRYLLDVVHGVYFLDDFMQRTDFFIKNPDDRYLGIERFYLLFQNRVGKMLFFDLNMSPGESYVKNLELVFSRDPQKNVPFSTYLFISTNIYKLLFREQTKEVNRLKDLLKSNNIKF